MKYEVKLLEFGGGWGLGQFWQRDLCFSQLEVASFIRRQNLVERGCVKLFVGYQIYFWGLGCQIYFLGFSINLMFFLKFWKKI